MNDPKSISVSSKHLQLIRLMTEIVEDAAMRAMIFAKPDDGRRCEYVLVCAARSAASSAQTGREVASAMVRLIQTGAFSRLPLPEQPERLDSPIYRSSIRSAKPAEAEPNCE